MERVFVWTGGGLFVGSLALTAWTYARWLTGGAADVSWPAVGIDAALLSMFALHHSLFARTAIKNFLAKAIPERLLRSFYVWVASLLLAALCLLWQPVGGDLYRATGWAVWFLILVQVIGVWMIAQSVRAIDPLELAGIRNPKEGDVSLQHHGVYGLVRHPLYLGWALVVFGAAHMTGDRLAFAMLTTAYLVIAIPWEERSLERQFGAAYRTYKETVKWRIVPFVY